MVDNKKIASNTLILYLRTIIVMVVSLYTSRITLQALGVTDYGIYNIVGGLVTMFSLVSVALSASISRYLTYEIGHGDGERLRQIFSMSINIQILLSIVVLLLGETLGLWAINHMLNIPKERMMAANWVYQCSLLTFVLNLLSVPYNALIIAHERMNTYAYVSLFEVSAKLVIAYVLMVSIHDKLILFAVLVAIVSLLVRFFYGLYCGYFFSEAHYQIVRDWKLAKEMTNFAGLNFFVNAASLCNTQGVNILINLFFGVGVNAARGVAGQVESAVTRFVNDFTTALNPQITKSYAQGDMKAMQDLVIRGSKFSSYLFLILSFPVLIETDYILHLWLVEVPEHTVVFIRLSIIGTMMVTLGNSGYTACMATGNIKKYSIWITSVAGLVFPITYVAFKWGAPVESAYFVFIIVYIAVDLVRLWLMRSLLFFPIKKFAIEVVVKLFFICLATSIFPIAIHWNYPQNFERFLIVSLVSTLTSLSAIWLIGLTSQEKRTLIRWISKGK